MNLTHRIVTLLIFFSAFTFTALAQENIAPVLHNPNANVKAAHHISTLRTTALTLPFFEDFTGYSAEPDTFKWTDRQVYVNNTMGVKMISRGVATFDALSQFGVPYDTTTIFALRYADSLTAKVIDLSAYVPSDSIYLSFFYQPAGNGFAPEKSDSLMLFFKTKAGPWVKVWSKSDTILLDFRQAMVRVADPAYLHADFQFRFVNKASLGVNDDVWNVDYIRMDAGRNIFDTAINDLAYTTTPTPLLNDYVSMPYRQYTANPAPERAATFRSIIKNNFPSAQVVPNFGYQAQVLNTGAPLSSGSDVNRTIGAGSTSDIVFNTYSATPGFGIHDKVIFENKFYLQSPATDVHKENDTIAGQQVFDNYLAYDDGTAEMSYYLNLFPSLPGKIAIEHHLNQADTLRGMAIYFGRQVPLATYKYFSIVVYQSIAFGASTTDNVLYSMDNLKPSYVDTVNHFWIYKFDRPVLLSPGTFYIGTTQPALSGSDSLYIGLDRNRQSGNHAYYNVLNVWSASTVSGALMMRPLLGGPISGTAGVSELRQASFDRFDIAPNPAGNFLQISLTQYGSDTQYEITNLLGSKMIQGKVTSLQQRIDVSELPAAMYLIQVRSGEKSYPAQKFLKQ